jgi:hypothetical protein
MFAFIFAFAAALVLAALVLAGAAVLVAGLLIPVADFLTGTSTFTRRGTPAVSGPAQSAA